MSRKNERHSRVWGNGNRIIFGERVNDRAHRALLQLLSKPAASSLDRIVLDFSETIRAYPDGMVPIICSLHSLRQSGVTYSLTLPADPHLARLFVNTNWAHFLSPEEFAPSDTVHDRHLALQKFTTPDEQQSLVYRFLDVTMRTMEIRRDLLAGLEWCMYEITDNVLNHAQADDGGWVQMITYHDSHQVTLTVADSGRGILSSMVEAFPALRTDEQAIGEAIKEGVTSRQNYGQGNGLAGTLRIATQSGGSFAVTSGVGKLIVRPDRKGEVVTERIHRMPPEAFEGTMVTATLGLDENFRVADALVFGGRKYESLDVIGLAYEAEDGDYLHIKLREETTGFGNRHSGEQMRTKLNNLLNAEPTWPLVIDWDGVPVVSSSFADEAVGKLFASLGPLAFSARVRNRNMEPLVRALIDKAITKRVAQNAAESDLHVEDF